MASTITALTSGGGIALSGDTSGNLGLQTANGTYTATVPQGNGTIAVQGVSTNIVSGTAVASTSGTSIDFTGIPSWVKRITVMLNGVSTNGTSAVQVQVGSGSYDTSGYSFGWANITGANTTVLATGFTTGFGTSGVLATTVRTGTLVLVNISGNTWLANLQQTQTDTGVQTYGNGFRTLSGALDRVRITTVNGTDTFDAGTINILYE